MRVAALYDIHGNLPALEAVLAEIAREKIDRVMIGGDIFPGPMCREVLARLRELTLPVEFIRGNCEVAMLAAREGRNVYNLPNQVYASMQWWADRLTADEKQFVASWPKTMRLEISPLGRLLFCHGTPRDENEIFARLTSDEQLVSIFADVAADLVICGHTHMQFDRTVGETRIVNAGSVGMPFGEPGAYWLLLGPEVVLSCVNYDLQDAARRIRATNYPQAEEFVTRYVLNPPSAAEMEQIFARAQASAR